MIPYACTCPKFKVKRESCESRRVSINLNTDRLTRRNRRQTNGRATDRTEMGLHLLGWGQAERFLFFIKCGNNSERE